jgi:TonB family protein
MERLGNGGVAHKARFVGVIAAIVVLAGACTANAQTSAPASNAIDQAPSEAARRAALSPYLFILQNASAPVRKPAPAAAAPAPAPAPVAEKKPAAPPAVQQAAAQRVAPSAPKSPVAETAASAASAEAAIASLSRQPTEPAPPPPHLEIIPVRTDEPRLPAALMRERPAGVVKVHFDIEPDGSVGEVKVTSSTNRTLNRPSIDAVQKWKFEPVDAVLTVETELVYKFDQ